MAQTPGTGQPQQGTGGTQTAGSSPQQEQKKQTDMSRRDQSQGGALRAAGGLTNFGPFGLLRRMMQEFDSLLGVPAAGVSAAPSEALWMPRVELFEREGKLNVRADLPGIEEGDVHLEVLDNSLILEGERRVERTEDERGIWRSEISYGSFRRVIPLPENADIDAIQARFDKGVLEIAVPLPKQEQRARRVEISKGEQKGKQGPVH